MNLIMFLIAMLVAPRVGPSSDIEYDPDLLPLIGLQGVKVATEGFSDDASASEVSELELQKDVHDRLKRAGIRALTNEEWLDTAGSPTLLITVTVATIQDKATKMAYGYSCWLAVELQEVVYLERHMANEGALRVVATVWNKSQHWILGKGELASKAKRGIREILDALVRDVRLAKKLGANLPRTVYEDD